MVYSTPFFILLACFIVPEHFPPWTAYHTEVPAFAAAVVALAVCWRMAARRVVLTSMVLPIALLMLSVLLQGILGQMPYAGDGAVMVAYLLVFGAACWWGTIWAERSAPARVVIAIAGFLVIAGLILVFQMLAQWLEVEDRFAGWVIDRPPHGRPYGNLGQPNQAGTLLVMASVGVHLLLMQEKFRRRVAWPLLLVFAWGIVLTQSRTALLSSTVLVAAAWFTAPASWVRVKHSMLLWLLAVYAGTWVFHSQLWGGLLGSAVPNMAAAGLRPLMWRQLLTALGQSPWFGWGWLQTATAQQAGALLVPGTEQTNYAHNALLDLFLALGIPAGAAFLLWLLVACWRRAPRALAHTGALSLLYVLIPFGTHAMLEFPHAYAYYLVLAGVMLGAIAHWTRAPADNSLGVPRAVLGVTTLALAALYLGLAVDYARVEEDFRVNRFENRRLGTTPADYQPPTPLLLSQHGELLAAMRLRAAPGMSPQDLALLQRVSKRFSWAPIHFRTALALALNGQPDLAQVQLKVIKAMYAPEIYEDARENWVRMSGEKYPQLASIALP